MDACMHADETVLLQGIELNSPSIFEPLLFCIYSLFIQFDKKRDASFQAPSLPPRYGPTFSSWSRGRKELKSFLLIE